MKAQVWIETILYTLIGLAVIGLLLVAARPKIAQYQDKIVVQQTITAINELHKAISETGFAPGTRKIVKFQLSRGEFLINAAEDKLLWKITSSFMYSEPGTEISLGKIKLLTEKKGDVFDISVALVYEEINILLDEKDKSKILGPTKIPYEIVMENLGAGADGRIMINFAVS